MKRNMIHAILAGGGLILAMGVDSLAQERVVPAPPADTTEAVPAEVVPPPKLVPPPALPPEPGPSLPVPDAPAVAPAPVHPPAPIAEPRPVTKPHPASATPYYVPNQRHIRYLPESVIPGTTGGLHLRYPYYSYRRPWYRPGPASVNVTIIW